MPCGDNIINMGLFNENDFTKIVFKIIVLQRFCENHLKMIANFGLCICTLMLLFWVFWRAQRKSLEVYVNEMDDMVSSPIKNG